MVARFEARTPDSAPFGITASIGGGAVAADAEYFVYCAARDSTALVEQAGAAAGPAQATTFPKNAWQYTGDSCQGVRESTSLPGVFFVVSSSKVYSSAWDAYECPGDLRRALAGDDPDAAVADFELFAAEVAWSMYRRRVLTADASTSSSSTRGRARRMGAVAAAGGPVVGSVASACALTLLCWSGEVLANTDLRGVKLAEANLRVACLDGADLRNVDSRNADLAGMASLNGDRHKTWAVQTRLRR